MKPLNKLSINLSSNVLKNIRAIACALPSVWVLLLFAPVSAYAIPAPVEELGGQAERADPIPANGRRQINNTPVGNYPVTAYPTSDNPVDNGAAGDDPYYRMQLLMEELRQLRGLLEEQSNELRLLKKRQQEDYLDLDGRLSALISGGSVSPPPTDDVTKQGSLPGSVAGSQKTNRDKQVGGELPTGQPGSDGILQAGQSELRQQNAYDQAYGLIKARRVDEAKVALKQFLLDYPQGPYTANAHYWLGEVYLLDGELPEAADEFSAVVQKYPGHRKVNDATFKLGKVYHLQNKLDKSRMLLERVAAGSDSAARLAQDYLLHNF